MNPEENYTTFDYNLKYLKQFSSEEKKKEYEELYKEYLELKKIYNIKRNFIIKEIENLDKIFSTLLDLPQLFIAV
jgi:hypothetical protein